MFNWNGGQPRYGFPQQQQQQMVPGLVPQGQFHFQQTMQQPMRWVPPQSAAPVGVGMMVGQAWSAANPSMLPMATTAPVGMPSLPGMSQGMMLNASRPQMPPLPDRPPLPAGPPLPEGPPPPLPDFPQDVRPPLPESPQAPPPEEPQPSEPDPTVLADLEKLKKEEDMFLDQYKNWKNQYDDWRQQNESHPNKEQFEQYLEQWKTYEKQMEARRKSIESQRQILEEKLAMSILSQPSAMGPPTSVSEPINVRPPVDSQSRNISGAGSSLGGRREDKGEQDMNLDDEDMNLDDEEESACGGIIVESAGQQSSKFGWDSSQTESKDKEVEDDNTKSGNLAEPGNTEQSDKQCEEPIKSQTETSQSFPGNFEGVGDGISQSNESEWEGEYHMSGMEGRGGFGMRGRGRGAQRGREESGRGRGRFGSDSNSMPYGGRRDDFEGDATGYENDWNQYGNEGFGNEDEGSMDGSNSGAGFGFDSSYRGGRGGFGRGRGGFESSMRGGGRGGFESSMRGGGRGGFEGGRGGFEGARGGFEGGRGGFEGGRGGFKGGRGGFEGGRDGFEGGSGGFEGGRGGFEGGRGGFEGGRGGFEGGRGGFEGGRGGFDRGRGGFESNIRGRGGRGGFEGGRGGFGRGGGGFEGREDGLESEFEEATDEFEGGGDGFEGGRGDFEGGRGGMGRGRGGFESGRGGRGGFRGGFDGGRGGYEGGRGGFEGGRGRGGFEGGRGGFEGGRGRGGMGRARGGFEGGRGGFEGGRGGFDGGRGGFGKGRGGFEGGRGGFEGGRGGFEGGRGGFEGGRGGFEGGRGGFEGGRGGFGGGFEGGRGGFEGGRGGRGGFGGGFEGGRGAFGRGRGGFEGGRGGFEGGRGAFGNARGGRGGGFDFGRGGYEGSRGRGRGGRGGFRGNDYGYSYGEQEAESYGYEETEYQEGGEYGNESSGWEGHGGEYGGNEEEYYEGNEDGSNYNGNNRFGRGGQFRQGFGRGQSQEGDDRNYESSEGNSGFGRGRGAGFRGRGRGMSKFSAMGDRASATEADADISTNYHDRGDRSNTDMSRSGEEDYEEGNWPTGDNSENTYMPRGGFQQRGLPRGRGGRGRGVGMGRGNGRVGNDFSDFSKSEAVEEGNNKQEGDEDSAAGKDSHFPSETGSFGSESSRGRGGAAGNRGRGRGNGARERNFSQDDEPPRKMGRLDPLDPMYDDRLGLYPDFDPYRRLPRDPYFRDPYLDPLDAFLPPPLPLYDYDRGYDYPPRFEPLPERRPAVAVESIDYGHGSSDQDKKAAAPAEVIEYGHGQTSKEEAKEKKADSIDDAKDFGDKDLRQERMNELSAQTARTYSSQDTIYDRYDKDREDLWQRQRLPQSHETDDYSRDWRKDEEEATSSIKLQDERSRFRDSQWDSGDMNRLKDKDERRSNENFTDRAAELYKRKEEEEVESLRFDDQYRSKDRWADRDRDDREQGDREMFDRERGDRARIVDREKGERDRFDRERSDRDRFDRERGDRDRIDRERSDRDRADRERGDRDRIDRERRSDREYRPSDYSESELERSIRGRERYEDRDRDRPERVDRRQTEEEGLNEYRGESRREKRAFGIGDEWLKEGKGRGVSDRTQSRYDNENSSRSSYSDRHVDNKDRSYRDKEYSYQGGERSFSRLDRVDYHKDSSAQFNDNDDVHGRQFGRERIGETSRRSDWREDDRHMKGVRDLPNTVPSPDRHVTPPTRGPSRGSAVTQLTTFETMKVEDILCSPQREKRPPQIVVIIRGLPGSGKTYISKLLREKEASYGGQAPRILCLDDYFMVEEEKEEKDPETGKRVKRKVLEYEYEQELEEAYRQSMLKSFKKTVDDGFFPFIIVDATNEKVVNFSEFWSYAKSRGFQVYVAEMVADISLCIQRNVHRWTEWDIEKVKRNWERLPNHYIKLDIRWLLQEDAIQEVEMEDTVNEKEEDNEDDDDEFSEGVYTRSKWEFDTSDKTLDKLDGIPVSKKHIIEHQSMDDYLQLDQDETDDDYFSRESLPGQKRVRWADLEEKKTQSRRRDLGFIVGQTQRDWDRITDDDFAEKALNQTKYFYK